MARVFPLAVVRRWEREALEAARNAADDLPDSEAVCIFFPPSESAALAATALMHGLQPPDGIPPSTWAEIRSGRCEALTFSQFAAFCDVCPTLLEDLRHVWQAAAR